MSNFNVTVDETANKVTINEDTGSIIVRGVGVQGPEGAAGGAPDWGDIGGTLSDQTDLQTALNAKQDLDSQLTSVAGLSYAGNSLKVVRVNAGENGFELATQTSGVTDHTALTNIGTNTHAQIDTHIANTSNPHSVTASQVGLGNVDNTSDANKPVSTVQQTAIDAKVSDTAYNATSWDSVTTVAPSKNAVRDQTETMLTSIAAKMPLVGGIFTGAVTESVVALTDAATIAVDATLGNIFSVTLGGNRTLGNPTGAVNGQKFVFRIRQDGTGSRTLAYDTKFRFGTDVTSPTLTTTAAKTDYIGVIYHSADDKFDVLAVVKGL